MPHPALDLIASKAKLAGALVAGGLIATAAVGGGALALSPVADSDPAVVVTESPSPSDTTASPSDSPSSSAAPTPTDTASPVPIATLAVVTPTPDATASPDGVVRVNMNHATVVSIDATSLVVTVDGTSYTWVLTDQTHYSGFYKDPTQIMPGMVLKVHGVKNGDAYLALHVISPGHNKTHHAKPEHKAKPAKTHGKGH